MRSIGSMCIRTLEALEAQCLAGSSTPPWRRPARRVAVLIPRPAPLEAYGGKIKAGPCPSRPSHLQLPRPFEDAGAEETPVP